MGQSGLADFEQELVKVGVVEGDLTDEFLGIDRSGKEQGE